MQIEQIANTDNFFSIEGGNVFFWGQDILPKAILIDNKIIKLISKLNLPHNEVIEIYDDDTTEFFKKVYKK